MVFLVALASKSTPATSTSDLERSKLLSVLTALPAPPDFHTVINQHFRGSVIFHRWLVLRQFTIQVEASPDQDTRACGGFGL